MLRSCCRWKAGVGGACVSGRSHAATGCSAAAPRAGPTWRLSPHTASCCLWSIAAKHKNSVSGGKTFKIRPDKTLSVYTPCTLLRSTQTSEDCWRRTPGRPRRRPSPSPSGSQNPASPRGACSEQAGQGAGTEQQSVQTEGLTFVMLKLSKALRLCNSNPASSWWLLRVNGSYQQVLLLTVNVSRADGIEGLVLFSNPPLSLWRKAKPVSPVNTIVLFIYLI